jgi:iron complex outermembrane recepter protein
MILKSKTALLCATGLTMAFAGVAHAQTTAEKPKAAPAPVTEDVPAVEEEAGDAIIVTGFRASLEKGLSIKKESIALVDSIVAEDIGKFPTQNIAEALQRLPGVDLVRNGESNEGQRIQLRGLGPEFTLTTFNGAPVRTTSSGRIGESTRDFNYDIFSSELFGRADVYKSPLAELEEGGVAGVVNLRTPRPFDRPGLKIGYSASANYSEQSKQAVPRGALQVSNTWGNFGISLGIAKSGNKNRRFGYEPTGGFSNEFSNLLYTSNANFNAGRLAEFANIPSENRAFINATTGALSIPANTVYTQGINTFRFDFANPAANLNGLTQNALRNALVPRLLRVSGTLNDRDRIGASGAIQYKDDRADFSLDVLYANLKDDFQREVLGFAPRSSILNSGGGIAPGAGLASIPASGGDQPAWVPIRPTIDANGLLAGTFGNVALQTVSTFRRSETEFLSASLNGKFQLSDSFSVEGQLGRTTSKANAVNITSVLNGINPGLGAAGVVANRNALNTITYSVSDPFNPTLSTNQNLNSPLLYNQLQLSGNNRIENDTQKNARLILEYKVDDLSGWDAKFRFGGSYVQSSKRAIQPNINNAPNNAANPLTQINIGTAGSPLLYANATEAQRTAFIQTIIRPIELAGQSQAGIPSSWLSLGRSFLDNIGFDSAARNAPVDLLTSFAVKENVTALFGMVDLVSTDNFKANFGLRYVNTKTVINNFVSKTVPASGGNPAVTSIVPQTLNGGYDNWLPSISLAYNITPNLIIRSLYSKTVTRSSLSLIARAFTIPNAGDVNVTAGNPNLRPQQSTGYDAAIEWYFNRGGILSLSGFSKVIKDRALLISTQVEFQTLGLDPGLFTSPINTGAGIAPDKLFNVSIPVNRETYKVQGIELAYQQSLRFLPKPFDGLGVLGSFTFIPTKTSPWQAINRTFINLQGIPRYAASGTIYYEKGPLSVRTSYTYRSERYTGGGTPNNNGLNFQQYENPRSYLDASFSYKIAKWLQLRIDGQNLTNTKTYEFSRSLTGQFGDEDVRAENAFQSGRTFTFGISGSF